MSEFIYGPKIWAVEICSGNCAELSKQRHVDVWRHVSLRRHQSPAVITVSHEIHFAPQSFELFMAWHVPRIAQKTSARLIFYSNFNLNPFLLYETFIDKAKIPFRTDEAFLLTPINFHARINVGCLMNLQMGDYEANWPCNIWNILDFSLESCSYQSHGTLRKHLRSP